MQRKVIHHKILVFCDGFISAADDHILTLLFLLFHCIVAPTQVNSESIFSSISMATESALIFLGTGCSSSIPYTRCLIRPPNPPCHVCTQSLTLPPLRNPNYRSIFFTLSQSYHKNVANSDFIVLIIELHRCNTSLLIDYCQNDATHKYILIDCGKTFRETVLRWFVFHHIPRIDSVSLFTNLFTFVSGCEFFLDFFFLNLSFLYVFIAII